MASEGMASENKEGKHPTAGHMPTTAAVTASAVGGPVSLGPRVPLSDDGGKKKKRKYSRGLRTVQDAERGLARASATLGKAVARGLSVYRKRSNKSSRKKRDGAIRDGIENWTRAMSRGMRVASKAPYQFVRRVNRRRVSKQIRDAVRLLTPPLLR